MKYIIITLCILLTGCITNTKYSITDDYARGLRWFERGSFNEAIRIWQPLVKKEDCDAEYRMGLMHFGALGTPQSFDTAHKLWVKAANGNQQRAQWALGDLYYQNESAVYHHCTKTPTCHTKKDLNEAYFWYKLFEKSAKYASERKYLDHILPKISSELSDKEKSEIEAKVNKWKPTPKDCGSRNMW